MTIRGIYSKDINAIVLDSGEVCRVNILNFSIVTRDLGALAEALTVWAVERNKLSKGEQIAVVT